MNAFSTNRGTAGLARGWRVAALSLVLMLGIITAAVASGQEILPGVYSASATPELCEAGLECTLTFTFENSSLADSRYAMTEATITVPDGFTVNGAGDVATSIPLVKNWTATVDGNTVLLSADNVASGLAPTESFTVPVNVTPSLSLVGPGHVFATSASGTLGTDSTEFDPEEGSSDPSVTVVNDAEPCLAGDDCETAEIKLNNTSAKAVASVGPTNELLTLSVGGSFSDGSACLSSSSFTPKGEAVTSNVTGDTRSHTVTVTLDKTINNSPGAPGQKQFQICAASDSQFTTKSGQPAKPNPETGFYEGMLPDCPVGVVPLSKCILSRSRNAADQTVIKYFVEPGDPISIPGLGGI